MIKWLRVGIIFTLLFALTVVGSLDAVHAEGAETNKKIVQYTVIGDSIGLGFGAFKGYGPRYRDHMMKDTNKLVYVVNRSVGGWQSDELIDGLKNNKFIRSAVRNGDVVTWNIGGNDLRKARNKYMKGTCGGIDNEDCLRAALIDLKSDWVEATELIIELRDGKTSNLKTMNMYNPYVAEDKKAKSYDGTMSRFEVFKPYLDEMNRFIEEKQSMGYQMADVYTAFNGASQEEDPIKSGLIFIDGLHPNDKGHKEIAKSFRSLGYDKFSR
ncbi:SGNH/GDSL hydrolase family protein [Mechercharimyces sp. CAU 1602]|uniref:SGNH/GDSL hydrolase family protein n=1 Tax=Mechercharimyces sp. CAU 1602 TaxID=2973933 RepID=UPI002161F8EB|nr:SGNH/GDSL hydrolase family protein [Mechercharimyces sp. CAU 1602]MCS1351062.1 SGNH/GDSL hydrolase family protein [Mechercharimyces sp. CAU 1602]